VPAVIYFINKFHYTIMGTLPRVIGTVVGSKPPATNCVSKDLLQLRW
jgi:hypothetical protein